MTDSGSNACAPCALAWGCYDTAAPSAGIYKDPWDVMQQVHESHLDGELERIQQKLSRFHHVGAAGAATHDSAGVGVLDKSCGLFSVNNASCPA